jgi:hypothetical protein
MGDIAIVHFKDSVEVSPAIYLHWGGSEVGKLLRKCKELMAGRRDVPYAAARFVGLAHEDIPGPLSLGIWNAPGRRLAEIRKDSYSHGDAGVFIVDVDTWEVETHGGYGLRDPVESNVVRQA